MDELSLIKKSTVNKQTPHLAQSLHDSRVIHKIEKILFFF